MKQGIEDEPFPIYNSYILVLWNKVQIYLIIFWKWVNLFFFTSFAVFMFPKVIRNNSFSRITFFHLFFPIFVCPWRKWNWWRNFSIIIGFCLNGLTFCSLSPLLSHSFFSDVIASFVTLVSSLCTSQNDGMRWPTNTF